MKNLILRSLSGVIYVGLIIGAILAGETAFMWLCFALIVLGLIEFSKLTNGEIKYLPLSLDLLFVTLPFISILFHSNALLFLMFPVLITRVVSQLYQPNDKNPLNTIAYSVMGVVYVFLPLLILLFLYIETSSAIVLAVFIMIWLNDTGAYVVGSWLGRKILPYKMFPRISPKKSWAGFVGGLVFTIISAIVFAECFSEYYRRFDLNEMIGLAVIVSIFATWGDLLESLFKRTVGVKDSGNLIPGHGGILDRIDSLLLVAPVVYAYVCVLSKF